MPKTQNELLAERVIALERQVQALSSGDRLRYTSIDDYSIPVLSGGKLAASIGKQADGSSGVYIRDAPVPPQISAPTIEAGETAGVVLVGWDGRTFGGRSISVIHGHVEVWAELVGDEWEPTVAPGDSAKRVGTIRDRNGGEVVVALPQAGVWAVWIRAVGADRRTFGPWSPVSTVEVAELVDTEAIEQELDEARQERQQYLEDFDQRTEAYDAAIGELDERVGPALESSISEAVTQAQSSISSFQQEWDESWDPEAIDELRGRVDATDAEVATAKAEAEQAKQDAAAAQANADALESRADATDAEVATAKAEAEQAKQDAAAAQAKADALEEHQNHLEATLAEKASASELDELDDILRGTADLSDQTANKFWANMAVVSRLQAVEGWIGGVALGDETVTARHVNMGDFTADAGFINNAFVNLIQGKQADFEDMMVGRIIAESGQVARLLVGGGAGNLINDPRFEGLGHTGDVTWQITGATRDQIRVRDSTSGYRVMEFGGFGPQGQINVTYGVNKEWPVKPGETYYLQTSYYRTSSTTVSNARFWIIFYDRNGDYLRAGGGWHELESDWNTGYNTVQQTYTVPEGVGEGAYMRVQYRVEDISGQLFFHDPVVRRGDPGRLIVQGLLQATEGEIQRLLTDETISRIVWAEIVRAGLLEADEGLIGGVLLKDGAVTLDKLNAIEEIAAALVRTVELEAGTFKTNDMTAMRIVSSLIEATTYLIHDSNGDVSVRLDGVANLIRGAIHAGVGGDSEIRLDYGDKTRRRGLSDEGEPDETWTAQTPYIDFHSDREYRQDLRPSIYLDDVEPNGRSDRAGMMVINPGYRPDTPIFRGKLNVVGDVQSNRFEPRERLQINTSLSDQPGVIQPIGQGVRIRGQVPSLTHSQEMFYTGQTDQASLAPGGVRKRTISWGVPVPRGRRDPIATPYMASVPSNNNAYIVANVSHRFTNSYRIDEYNPSTASANYWVGVIAPWRDV